jgi:holo-[acyl-carrier protein] synthase
VSIVGVGLDLVEIARIRRMMDRHGDRVVKRLLTASEESYCLGQAVAERHVAARVAAKEAAYKALSHAGSATVAWWHDLEVVRDERGRPDVAFRGRAERAANELGVSSTMLSITHSDTHAAAVVILVR